MALADRPIFCTSEHLTYLFEVFGRIGLNRQIGRFYLLKKYPKLSMKQANEIIDYYLATYHSFPAPDRKLAQP